MTNSTFGKPEDKAETERIEAAKDAQREKEYLLTVLTPDLDWEFITGKLTFFLLREEIPVRYKPSRGRMSNDTVSVFITATDATFQRLKNRAQNFVGVAL